MLARETVRVPMRLAQQLGR